MVRSLLAVAATIGATMLTCVPAAIAGDLTLDFNSLPTTQGWTYEREGNSLSESSVFSVSGGVLHQDTLAAGFPSGGSDNEYMYSGAGVSDNSFSIAINTRVTNYSVGSGFGNDPFGFSFGVFGANGEAAVGITPSYICFVPSSPWSGSWDFPVVFSGDNTGYHDYLLTGSLAPSGSFSLYRDGLFIGSDVVSSGYSTPVTTLRFGDATAGGNAIADIASYSYSSNPLPEPASLTLLGPVLLGLGIVYLRRRGRKPLARNPIVSSDNETGPVILSLPSYRAESKRKAA
jgi:hypothetical protein